MTSEPVRYYWCPNCGHHGDFGKEYKIRKSCEKCNYDEPTPFFEDELKDHEDLCLKRFKKKNTY